VSALLPTRFTSLNAIADRIRYGKRYKIMEDNILQILTEIKDLLRDGRAQSSPWLSPEEAARYLDMSPSKIYKMIAEDQIPHHRPPHTRLTRLHEMKEEFDDIMRRIR
jgi:excisionase family DNA binding protein